MPTLQERMSEPPPVLVSVVRMLWNAAKYLTLIALSSIVGAHLGSIADMAIGFFWSDAAWAAHGRSAGWTIFVVVAAIGAPFGFVYFGTDSPRAKRNRKKAAPRPEARKPPTEPAAQSAPEPDAPESLAEPPITGMKARLVAPAVGAFMGLILGGMLGGFLAMIYFFVALSPFCPGGWWPILQLSFRASGDGFSTNAPFLAVLWLIGVGVLTLGGAVISLFTTISVGSRRYQVFGK